MRLCVAIVLAEVVGRMKPSSLSDVLCHHLCLSPQTESSIMGPSSTQLLTLEADQARAVVLVYTEPQRELRRLIIRPCAFRLPDKTRSIRVPTSFSVFLWLSGHRIANTCNQSRSPYPYRLCSLAGPFFAAVTPLGHWGFL